MPNFSNYFVDLERPSRHRSHLTSIKHIRCQHGHAIRRIIVQIFRREGEASQLIHGLACGSPHRGSRYRGNSAPFL